MKIVKMQMLFLFLILVAYKLLINRYRVTTFERNNFTALIVIIIETKLIVKHKNSLKKAQKVKVVKLS